MRIITIPGIYGSGDAHWQSLWEKTDPSMVRFQPADWDRPLLADWISALEQKVREAPDPPVLVAHSLGCLLVAHWATRTSMPIRGALLVSVPDPEGPNFPLEARSFAEVPRSRLPFPALVVSSQDDPYGSQPYARATAEQWGAAFVAVGNHGHINASSGLGEWHYGRGVLDAFVAGLVR
ncbi:MAG TPA: alpha/beta fold hydrolase [Noviherbaspirillum sp.]|jgi:predicted alpha/beta hydrolase family esterase|uniref:RBBP9/YdeN family alpha/beta hydrolase n=1 Tax=Noviherbaspirillum sp. TaxID=1926288 RepID=UPI002F941684